MAIERNSRFAVPGAVARRAPPPQAAGVTSDTGMRRRTPSKIKGGTKGLLSRSGEEGPGRPCPDDALSGRCAALDGLRDELGGPERAGVSGSGEALSAGRMAAPWMSSTSTGGGQGTARGFAAGEGA